MTASELDWAFDLAARLICEHARDLNGSELLAPVAQALREARKEGERRERERCARIVLEDLDRQDIAAAIRQGEPEGLSGGDAAQVAALLREPGMSGDDVDRVRERLQGREALTEGEKRDLMGYGGKPPCSACGGKGWTCPTGRCDEGKACRQCVPCDTCAGRDEAEGEVGCLGQGCREKPDVRGKLHGYCRGCFDVRVARGDIPNA